MLTLEEINKIRANSGLPPKGTQNYVGKYDYLKQEKQSRFQETVEDIKQTGSAIKKTYQETKQKIGDIAKAEVAGEQGKLRSFGQAFGTIAGGVSRGIGDVFTGGVKTVLKQESEEDVKEKVATAVEKLSKVDEALGRPIGSAVDAYNAMDEKSKRDVGSLLGVGSLALDLFGFGVGKKAITTTVKTGKEVLETGAKAVKTGAEELAQKGKVLATETAGKVQKIVKPQPTPMGALREVLQGKTKDIKQGLKSLSELDISGVKTYKDLKGVISNKIKTLSSDVDKILSKDKALYKLNDLKLVKKTVSGADVVINPVKRAFTHLSELYTKIGDEVKGAELLNLIKKSKKQGLSKLEINNLAREYGKEFGSKAFGKMGDALTSINAKLFENTRKSLKELARTGVSGSAKRADELMSNLYNTEKLIDKSIEAVNTLQQKIRNRGMFEKIGYNIAKYSDILSGGTIRGIVGGLLPRGVGYKTLNALDIENALKSNLEIIQKAIKSKSDDEINILLNKLDESIKK